MIVTAYAQKATRAKEDTVLSSLCLTDGEDTLYVEVKNRVQNQPKWEDMPLDIKNEGKTTHHYVHEGCIEGIVYNWLETRAGNEEVHVWTDMEDAELFHLMKKGMEAGVYYHDIRTLFYLKGVVWPAKLEPFIGVLAMGMQHPVWKATVQHLALVKVSGMTYKTGK